jgi:putative FmdB family regulatory protein
MPIYEYKCQKCGKEFEVFQGISDRPIEVCKYCGGPVHKLMSLSTFHLKGSGWYATDYGGKKAPAAEKGEIKPPDEKTPVSKKPQTADPAPVKTHSANEGKE